MTVPTVAARRVPSRLAVALTLAGCGLFRAPAAAQEPLPHLRQTVVVTASIAPGELSSTGRTVWFLSQEDVRAWGIRSLIEGLRLLPGVDVRARGPRDVQTDLSLRGATFGQNLVLVDGARMNDSQSGHHNGELPTAALGIDRIEVVQGAGSAVHGADALGGTINVITRRGRYREVSAAAGQHGYADAQAVLGGMAATRQWSAVGWASRSGGFQPNRDFTLGGGGVRGDLARGLTVDVRHQRRAFGAEGFYGRSDSREWTDQTVAAGRWLGTRAGWTEDVQAHVRDHNDHFLWSQTNPAISRNRHRTQAVDARLALSRGTASRTITIGGGAGGDRVRSTNLGDRTYTRAAIFGEWREAVGDRAALTTGVRVDRYSTFGVSMSPSLATAIRLNPALSLRASLARAFRVPTFTELYYRDPNNEGSPTLGAERSWSVDGGFDWFRGGWTGSVSVFRRWDADVIDWVRASSADRWRSTNLRDVRARGVELAAARRWRDTRVQVHYAGLDLAAPVIALESKYVLEYARHQAGGSVLTPVGAGIRLAISLDFRHRRDGQSYTLVGARLARTMKRMELSLDATNLLDRTYHEVVGVAMPGRWITAGITIR